MSLFRKLSFSSDPKAVADDLLERQSQLRKAENEVVRLAVEEFKCKLRLDPEGKRVAFWHELYNAIEKLLVLRGDEWFLSHMKERCAAHKESYEEYLKSMVDK